MIDSEGPRFSRPNKKARAPRSPLMSCRHKRQYATQTQAISALIKARRSPHTTEKATLNAYLCEFCAHWHLGHKRKT